MDVVLPRSEQSLSKEEALTLAWQVAASEIGVMVCFLMVRRLPPGVPQSTERSQTQRSTNAKQNLPPPPQISLLTRFHA